GAGDLGQHPGDHVVVGVEDEGSRREGEQSAGHRHSGKPGADDHQRPTSWNVPIAAPSPLPRRWSAPHGVAGRRAEQAFGETPEQEKARSRTVMVRMLRIGGRSPGSGCERPVSDHLLGWATAGSKPFRRPPRLALRDHCPKLKAEPKPFRSEGTHVRSGSEQPKVRLLIKGL